MADCSFTNNIAYGTGGGVSVLRSTLAIENCMITGNSSDGDGGGVYAGTDTMTIHNSTISENVSGLSGGGNQLWRRYGPDYGLPHLRERGRLNGRRFVFIRA